MCIICLVELNPRQFHHQYFQVFLLTPLYPPHPPPHPHHQVYLSLSRSLSVWKTIRVLDGDTNWAGLTRLHNLHLQACSHSIWFPSGWYMGHVQIETENISALLVTYPSSRFPAGAQLNTKNDGNGIQNISSNSSDLRWLEFTEESHSDRWMPFNLSDIRHFFSFFISSCSGYENEGEKMPWTPFCGAIF